MNLCHYTGGSDCSICFEPVSTEEFCLCKICKTTIMHARCIIKWFCEHNNCPTCRGISTISYTCALENMIQYEYEEEEENYNVADEFNEEEEFNEIFVVNDDMSDDSNYEYESDSNQSLPPESRNRRN